MNDPVALGSLVAKAQSSTALVVVLTALAIAVGTRLLTGKAESGPKDARIPPTPGFWVPYLGHVPEMAWDAGRFLARLRDTYSQGIFSLHLRGSTHTFVYRRELVMALVGKNGASADEDWMGDVLLQSSFGVSRPDMANARTALRYIRAKDGVLLAGSTLEELVGATVRHLRATAADLVTFNSSPADQADWERLAEADVTESADGTTYVEADLLELVRAFTSQTVNTALLGSNFTSNFDDFAQVIGHFDAGFLSLAAGVPSWVPWYPMQRARGARRRALSYLREFGEAMEGYLDGGEPGIKWQDMDDVSKLIKERAKVYNEHRLPIGVRAASDLAMAWELTTTISPLIFWVVLELCRDTVLLAQVREEMAPYVQVLQPENEFGKGVWIAPAIKSLDVQGLVRSCPLLVSAYVETVRLYACAGSSWRIDQDTLLKDHATETSGYFLQKGTYVHAPREMPQLDPRHFPSPQEWQGTRHIRESADKDGRVSRKVDMEAIRPHGKCRSTSPQGLRTVGLLPLSLYA